MYPSALEGWTRPSFPLGSYVSSGSGSIGIGTFCGRRRGHLIGCPHHSHSSSSSVGESGIDLAVPVLILVPPILGRSDLFLPRGLLRDLGFGDRRRRRVGEPRQKLDPLGLDPAIEDHPPERG